MRPSAAKIRQMSYDFYIFGPPGPADDDALEALMEAEEELLDQGAPEGVDPPPLGSVLEAFLAEVEQRWPGEPDDAPWASWPIERMGTTPGLLINVRWSQAEEMSKALSAIVRRHGAVAYDPQSEVWIRPRRGLFRR